MTSLPVLCSRRFCYLALPEIEQESTDLKSVFEITQIKANLNINTCSLHFWIEVLCFNVLEFILQVT